MKCLVWLTFVLGLLAAAVGQAASTADRSDAYQLGVQRFDAGDLAGAVSAFQEGSDAGDPESQFALGSMYYFGDGVERNYASARERFEAAAAARHAGAIALLGQMWRDGLGVTADHVKAARLLEQAATACEPAAQLWLAELQWRQQDQTQENGIRAFVWSYFAYRAGEDQAADIMSRTYDALDEAQRTLADAMIVRIQDRHGCGA